MRLLPSRLLLSALLVLLGVSAAIALTRLTLSATGMVAGTEETLPASDTDTPPAAVPAPMDAPAVAAPAETPTPAAETPVPAAETPVPAAEPSAPAPEPPAAAPPVEAAPAPEAPAAATPPAEATPAGAPAGQPTPPAEQPTPPAEPPAPTPETPAVAPAAETQPADSAPVKIAPPDKTTTMLGGPEPVTLTPEEQRFVDLVNQERKKAGVPELVVAPLLVRTAREKSKEMHDLNYWGHASPVKGKSTALYRVMQALPQAPITMTVGENLYYCPAVLVDSGHQALMNSPTHKKNILYPDYRYIGVGGFIAPDKRFWVTEHFLTIDY